MHEELRPGIRYLHGLVTTDSRNERAAALAVELQDAYRRARTARQAAPARGWRRSA